MKLKKITKLILVIIYIIVIIILTVSAFLLFVATDKKVNFKDTITLDNYSYLKINKMSESFANIANKELHFVEEKINNNKYHIYIIAINKKDKSKYQDIIDYTYEKATEAKELLVSGYPIETPKEIKKIALKNLNKFIRVEDQNKINNKNFEDYLKNVYLDTTIKKNHKFNYLSTGLLILDFMLIVLLIFTCFYKEEI